MEKINKDMTIMQVININQDAVKVFSQIGMHCVGCAAARGETVAEAAEVHGLNIDELIKMLNEASEK